MSNEISKGYFWRHEVFQCNLWRHETFQPFTMGHWEIFIAMKYLEHRNGEMKHFVFYVKLNPFHMSISIFHFILYFTYLFFILSLYFSFFFLHISCINAISK